MRTPPIISYPRSAPFALGHNTVTSYPDSCRDNASFQTRVSKGNRRVFNYNENLFLHLAQSSRLNHHASKGSGWAQGKR